MGTLQRTWIPVPAPTMADHKCLQLPFQRIRRPLLASMGTACTWYIDLHASKVHICRNQTFNGYFIFTVFPKSKKFREFLLLVAMVAGCPGCSPLASHHSKHRSACLLGLPLTPSTLRLCFKTIFKVLGNLKPRLAPHPPSFSSTG